MDARTPLGGLDHLIGFVTGMTLAVGLLFATRRSRDRGALLAAAAVKAAYCLTLSYLTYYDLFRGSDVVGYHDSGVEYAQRLREDLQFGTGGYASKPLFFLPQGTNTDRCRSLSGFAHWLTLDSLIGASLLFTALGFVGQALLYRAFVNRLPDRELTPWWRFGLLFMPSLTFWSSGLLKDPVGLFGLGLTFWGLTTFLDRPRPRAAFITATGLYALLLYRSPLIPVFLLASCPLLLASNRGGAMRLRRAYGPIVRIAAFAAGCLALVYFSRLDSRLSVDTVAQSMLAERGRYSLVGGGSTLTDLNLGGEVNLGGSSTLGLLGVLPESVIFTLCRPFPWEAAASPMTILASLENTALIGVVAYLWIRTFIRPARALSLAATPLFWTCALLTVFFAFALGVSTPNLGTVSRYRMPLMPFYWGAIVIMRSNLNRERHRAPRTATGRAHMAIGARGGPPRDGLNPAVASCAKIGIVAAPHRDPSS